MIAAIDLMRLRIKLRSTPVKTNCQVENTKTDSTSSKYHPFKFNVGIIDPRAISDIATPATSTGRNLNGETAGNTLCAIAKRKSVSKTTLMTQAAAAPTIP
jgi:hypothetical protein